jgi:hypothetical protein
MALSGQITGVYRGYTLQANWTASQNIAGNYSDITIKHVLVIGSAYSLNIGSRSNSCTVDGAAQSYSSPAINRKGGSVALGTTTHRVNHNADGSKTCTIRDVFNINATLDGVKVSNITASGNITLDAIPRQATITSANDFTDDGTPSLQYSNSGGFTASASLVFGGKTITRANAITGKSGTYNFSLTDAERETLRAACTGISMQVTYRLTTTIGGTAYTSDVVRTMSISDAAPILGAASYADANTATIAITDDSKVIVQRQSDLQVTFGAATAQKGATISSYEVTFAGVTKTASSVVTLDFGKVDVSSDMPLVFSAIDSRGLKTSTIINVKVEPWWEPTSTIELKRKNNFEPETHITATAWYASLDAKNDVTLTAKYRKSGSSDAWSTVALANGVESTVACERDYAYEWQITTADKLGSTTQMLTLGRGIPTFFIDTSKSSVGVNCFPAANNVLQLGDNAFLTAQGAYPVGAIYLSVNNTDPATLFGGTWERIGGRFLLGADDTYAAGSTGGEAEHTLTIDEMPRHNHSLDNYNTAAGNTTPYMTVQAQSKVGYGGNVQTLNTGGGKPHNNLPPYLSVYMWKRVS